MKRSIEKTVLSQITLALTNRVVVISAINWYVSHCTPIAIQKKIDEKSYGKKKNPTGAFDKEKSSKTFETTN